MTHRVEIAFTAALLAASPAAAQPTTELELGGGFHIPFTGGDLIEMPRAPTADMRITRWSSGSKWGISGRALIGIGSTGPVHSGGHLWRENPMHFHALVRYKTETIGSSRSWSEFGVGGGVFSYSENWRYDAGDVKETVNVFPYFPVLEALRTAPLTDRLTLKVGVTLVFPALYPFVSFAWKLL